MINQPIKLKIENFKHLLKARKKDSHKNMFGHVVIVGGDYGFSGAIKMSAEAALRVGAGLVSVATRPDIALTLNIARPEIMCHGIKSEKILNSLLETASVIVLGPGMGITSWGKKLFTIVLKQKKPLIIDADGLNILATQSIKRSNWIITPHPGEASKLLKLTKDIIQNDRVKAVQKLQTKFNGISVLKGFNSLICTDEELFKCEAGNPGMATAGMGDILTGVIAGLIGQKFSLSDASTCGVLIHSLAGDMAAKNGERGMIATDLLPHLRNLVNL
ncbi:NAD(P)H-hydrate dehydratase [Gammaproteobacteria bacterium]|nr:NAD(P)H-hydrate dehydratase [Gammaproteobacteria bacterium]